MEWANSLDQNAQKVKMQYARTSNHLFWLAAVLLSSQRYAPPAGMLAHRRGRYRWHYDASAQCQIAVPQCGQPLLSPLKITCTIPPDTAHQRDRGFHASAKYLTLRHFSHFGMKKLLGTGARTVRGWREIRQLASTRSD